MLKKILAIILVVFFLTGCTQLSDDPAVIPSDGSTAESTDYENTQTQETSTPTEPSPTEEITTEPPTTTEEPTTQKPTEPPQTDPPPTTETKPPEAEPTPIENFEYTINDYGVTITKYIGKGIKDVVLPAEIEGRSVISIGKYGEYPFRYCDSLTSITIPNSVSSIGERAFEGCSLTSIMIPSSISCIEYEAFLDCASLTSVMIPNGVTSIRYGAFAYCTSLTYVVIPESITNIGGSAFYKCDLIPEETKQKILQINYWAFDEWSEPLIPPPP